MPIPRSSEGPWGDQTEHLPIEREDHRGMRQVVEVALEDLIDLSEFVFALDLV